MLIIQINQEDSMFKGLVAGLLIFSSIAMADVKTYKVEGMHCEDCVSAVKEKVCGIEGLAKCNVEMGQVTLASAEGSKLDDNAVTNAVQAAGYKIADAKSAKDTKEGMSCEHKD